MQRRKLKIRTCSRCKKKGHNARSCVQNLNESDNEEDQEEEDEEQEDDEEEHEEVEEEDDSREPLTKKQRVCSNCGKKGYNSRTCDGLK